VEIVLYAVCVFLMIASAKKITELRDKITFYKFKVSRISDGLNSVLKIFIEKRKLKKDRDFLNSLRDAFLKEMKELGNDDYEIYALMEDIAYAIKKYNKKR